MADLIRTRATIIGQTGLPGLFTAYYAPSGAVGTAQATEALARVRAFFDSFKAHLPGTVQVTSPSEVDVINDANGDLVARVPGTPPATVSGTGAGTAGAAPLMFVLQHLTGVVVGKRVVRGRSFIGPTIASDNSVGNPTATSISALMTAAALLGTTIVTPLGQVVWHRPSGVPKAGGSSVLVTGHGVWTQWGVLRSRRD